MPRFNANLNTLFTELPFLERFQAAAAAGFKAVEILNPYGHPAATIAKQLVDHKLDCVLINTPRIDWDKGLRGLACLPDRTAAFAASVEQALDYCTMLRCPRLHVLAGLGDPERNHAAYIANVRKAAQAAAAQRVTITLEPINQRDMPGFFLRNLAQAAAAIAELNEPNVRIQIDCYHLQITEGDVETRLRRHLGQCGHIQVAGVPARHEPDTGELNYRHIFALLDELGYNGWVGCEYHPAKGTVEGLGWLKAWPRAS